MEGQSRFVDRLEDMSDLKACIQLYSGGLDSRYFLLEAARRGISVVALRVLMGAEDPIEVATAARAAQLAGAEYLEIDCKTTLANDFISSAIIFNARYGNQYPVCSSLSRPLMAMKAVEVARQRGIDCIVHNATWIQNSAMRLNNAIRALAPETRIAVPFIRCRIDREAKARALQHAGIPVPSSGLHSVDANLWGRVIEAGSLDDPSTPVPEQVFLWTRPQIQVPEQSTRVKLTFRNGLPVAIDHHLMPLPTLIEYLNELGGRYRVGRFNGLEDTSAAMGGIKNHEVREAPAACAIIQAHLQLEQAALNQEELRWKAMADWEWTRQIVNGAWFGYLKKALDGFGTVLSSLISGEIDIEYSVGNIFVSSIECKTAPCYWNVRQQYEQFLEGLDVKSLWSILDLPEALRKNESV